MVSAWSGCPDISVGIAGFADGVTLAAGSSMPSINVRFEG